jgi:preprotein translocase subunit YajC
MKNKMSFSFLAILGTLGLSFAEGGQPAGGGSLISALVWMVLLVAIFYFLLLRPQQKQKKQHQEFIDSLKKGDKVITSGGIIGEIKSIDDDVVTLKVSEGTLIKVLKQSITSYYQQTKEESKESSK